MRWHCPPDTGFEIRSLAVWGRARYLSVTEAPHNTDFHTWMGKKHFCFFQTAETGNRTPNSGVKGSGANHYPRAPALYTWYTRGFKRTTSYTAPQRQTPNRSSCWLEILAVTAVCLCMELYFYCHRKSLRGRGRGGGTWWPQDDHNYQVIDLYLYLVTWHSLVVHLLVKYLTTVLRD